MKVTGWAAGVYRGKVYIRTDPAVGAPFAGTVVVQNLNVRDTPSVGAGNIIGSLNSGDHVGISGQTTDVSGNLWYKISYEIANGTIPYQAGVGIESESGTLAGRLIVLGAFALIIGWTAYIVIGGLSE